MSLKETLSTYWIRIQEELLPWLDDTTLGPLSGHHKQLVSVLGMVRIEAFLPGWQGLPGRPPSERAALARAFVAKEDRASVVSWTTLRANICEPCRYAQGRTASEAVLVRQTIVERSRPECPTKNE